MDRIPALSAFILCFALTAVARAEVKRVVVLKADGIPASLIEQYIQSPDPATGKHVLPWMSHIFAENGVRLRNYYTRGITVSVPAWSITDTGEHLQIKGNVEYDRFTCKVYDYLNFFPFYVRYATSKRVDMPGVEVLDQAGIPLLSDRFGYGQSYQGFQLFQRGVRWKSLKDSLQHRFTSRSPRELFDEWQTGFDMRSSISDEVERELVTRIRNTGIPYLDSFTGEFDHVAHLTNDPAALVNVLREFDALAGRVWSAIQSSPLAEQTVLAVVSDHGMNNSEDFYSQGFNMVTFLTSPAAGSHNVATNRYLLEKYKLKGLDPFVSLVITPGQDAGYDSSQYPTAMLDLDGNERASIHLRQNDLNLVHALLLQLAMQGSIPDTHRRATRDAVIQILDKHRAQWTQVLSELDEELTAIRAKAARDKQWVRSQPKKFTAAERDLGLDKNARRVAARVDEWEKELHDYADYAQSIKKLLALRSEDLTVRMHVDDLIPKRAMGDANSLEDLRNYTTGPGPQGFIFNRDGVLDLQRSFRRIDYLSAFSNISVQNNPQSGVDSHPVDFITVRLPQADLPLSIGSREDLTGDAVLLYAGSGHQAILLSKYDVQNGLRMRYVPVQLSIDSGTGQIAIAPEKWMAGLPLKLWEDPALTTGNSTREAWLSQWHTESDWFRAAHRTKYSNALIGLHEQFTRWAPPENHSSDGDARERTLIRRFYLRKRRLVEPDMLIFANDHWNFNVRGFNPGGNHGSFLRASTHATLMFAGGSKTGVRRGAVIDEPYDALSFVPTILQLTGKDGIPVPGRLIAELIETGY